jgi:hypothetical protein
MDTGRATVGPRSGVWVTEPELYPQLFMLAAGRALPLQAEIQKARRLRAIGRGLDGFIFRRPPHQVGELSERHLTVCGLRGKGVNTEPIQALRISRRAPESTTSSSRARFLKLLV